MWYHIKLLICSETLIRMREKRAILSWAIGNRNGQQCGRKLQENKIGDVEAIQVVILSVSSRAVNYY